MRRTFNIAAVTVMLMLAGSAYAAPRETREQGREHSREQGIVKMVKKVVRALGDGLTFRGHSC